MKVAIAGGTGFVGQVLTKLLQNNGYEVVILTRKPSKIENGIHYVQWLSKGAKPEEELENITAIVNLAGVSLNEGRWTEKQKTAIYDSRMSATIEIVRIIEALTNKPKVLINASAIGIYPASTTATYTEKDTKYSEDFLGTVVQHWERHAERASQFGVRVAYGRFGVILGADSMALSLMTLPYRLYVGGTVGSGQQWLSWVHVEDAARAILFAIEIESIAGPFNITAPQALRMKEFGQTIGKVLGKPHWMPVPSIAMKMVLGEKSQLVLEGQHVFPTVLQENNFQFHFPTLELALKDLFESNENIL